MEIEQSEQSGRGTEAVRGFGTNAPATSVSEPPAAEMLTLDVACDSGAPAIVRAALSQIDGLGWVLGDALLVASELVTNAVVHSGGSATDVLRVSVSRGPERLLISVHDPGVSGRRAQPRPTEDFEPHGWGLRIVEQLSARWGTERRAGYRVWAELAAPAVV